MPIDSKATADFVSLLTRHQDVLRVYIISQVPGSADVYDILQEVNITLWEKRDDFKMGTNFGAWAYKIAFYKVINYKKKLKNSKALVFGENLEEMLAEEISAPSPELLNSKLDALKRCLSDLKPKHRELLEARYSGCPENMNQFSTDNRRSRGSLRVTLSRLRASLRDCVRKRLTMEGGAL